MKKGFIALMSSIIISAILILVAASTGLQGFYVRSNVLDAELKEESLSVAEGCSDMAILQLKNDSNYSGGATFALDGCICTLGSISNSGSQKVFEIRVNCQDFNTNLKVTLNSSDMSAVSWEEIPAL
jgi:hypothetical protein